VFNSTICLRDTFAKEVGGKGDEPKRTDPPTDRKKTVKGTPSDIQTDISSAAEIISAVEERLAIARLGLKDMEDPKRARSGLYNAVVFGRMVTFALQNMRGKIDGFDDWYESVLASLKADELSSFMNELRTKIEKTAQQQAGGFVRGGAFNVDEIRALPNKPKNAKDFFIGDPNGGSGWEVVMPDGKVEKYYVDLPPSWQVETGVVLQNAPERYRKTDARVLVGAYLDTMADIVDAAKKRFL
jgi:glutaminyl-tRNA synthetase